MATGAGLTPYRIGRISEYLIRLCYQARGYRLIHANWRVRGGELDLVLRRGTRIVFVEVRGRTHGGLVCALDSFTDRKRLYFQRCVTFYLHRHPGHPPDVRLDFAAVTWKQWCPCIRIVKAIAFIDVRG